MVPRWKQPEVIGEWLCLLFPDSYDLTCLQPSTDEICLKLPRRLLARTQLLGSCDIL